MNRSAYFPKPTVDEYVDAYMSVIRQVSAHFLKEQYSYDNYAEIFDKFVTVVRIKDGWCSYEVFGDNGTPTKFNAPVRLLKFIKEEVKDVIGEILE